MFNIYVELIKLMLFIIIILMEVANIEEELQKKQKKNIGDRT